MKCPHCNYEFGWSNDKGRHIEGESGDFYCLPVEVKRERSYTTDRSSVYGCPSPDCGILFIVN